MAPNKRTPTGTKKDHADYEGAFQLVFNQSPIPMWIYDLKSLKIIDANESLVQISGYERKELEKIAVTDLLHANEVSLPLKDLKIKPDSAHSLGTGHLCRKNGALIRVELTAQVYSGKSNSSILVSAKQFAIVDRATTPREQNQLKHAVFENLRGVIIFSLDTQYCYIAFTASHKEVMKSIWGADIEIGMNMLEFINREDDRIKAKNNFDRALRGEYITVEEEYGSGEEYQRMWWENRYSPVYDMDNRIIGLTIFVIDITQRKLVERALQTSENNYHEIMNQASDGIFISSPDGKYVDVNQAACDMLGYSREELLNLSIRDLVDMADASPLRLDELLAGKVILAERRMTCKDGSKIIVEVNAKKLADGRLQGIARNITERKEAEAEILNARDALEKLNAALQKAFEHEQIASRTDNLTGVFNRRYFFEFIEYEFSMSKRYQLPMSVILFDVDNLKQINDTYGHLAGDDVLIAISQKVHEELRDSDILARYGGDEFIILVPNNSAESIRNLMERIRLKLESSIIETYGHQLTVTISAGVADVQPDADTPTRLVRRADQALYTAKQGGRNRVAYASI